jgi:hypothetical protein
MSKTRLGDRLLALATHDFSPRFSANVRRLVGHPLGILILAGVVSLLCGLFLHAQGFVLCGGVLAVVALGVIWPWLSIRGLAGTVAFDRSRASEGEAVEVRLILRNRLPWTAWGLAVRGGFGGGATEPVAGVASAPRRRTAMCRWAFTPSCRGVYPNVTPRLATGFPFGLWENSRPLSVETPLIVWPRTFPVGPIPPVSGDRQVEGNVSRSKVGTNGDVLGVRPYRRGDSPRRIHWRQSARHDRLVVCELQSNSRPVIQIVLDADPRVHAGTGPNSSREWAIRIVASFAKGWLADGAQVGVSWGGHDNLVPTPAMLTRFRISKVDKPDYYEWDYEGVLALAGRKKTPPGVVVTTDCRTLAPARLPEAAYSRTGTAGGTPPELGEVPDAIRPEIDRLAREWAGDRERGWPQIEAVVTKLRTEYTSDRTAAAPPDHPAPVLWFLLESRRGSDYLFATAAALLLRSLDYSTRVCLGYYASPDAYDPQTAHTPVRKTDLHTWAEVRLGDGHWMVVEPTPGYAVLGPKLPMSERILQSLVAVAAWAGRHAVELLVTVAALVLVWVRRRAALDAAAVGVWRLWPGRTWRVQVRRAVRLLERRGRWAGRPRGPRQTACSWLRSVRPDASEDDTDLDRLIRMSEWAAYAPEVPPPWDEADAVVVCRRVLDGWTLQRWRQPDPFHAAMGA